MNGLFITGSNTEVGKTWVSCALIRSIRQSGVRVGAYKPVASGVTELKDSDAFRLWKATGSCQTLEMVCPQSFAAPLAPPLAALIEGRNVDLHLLTSGVQVWNDHCDFLIVEGAGGLLSPLTFETTNADLAVKLGLPIVIVVANQLGAVNQSLMAYEAALAKKLRVAALVLNDPVAPIDDSDTGQHSTMIEKLLIASGRTVPPIVTFAYGQTHLILGLQCLEASRGEWAARNPQY